MGYHSRFLWNTRLWIWDNVGQNANVQSKSSFFLAKKVFLRTGAWLYKAIKAMVMYPKPHTDERDRWFSLFIKVRSLWAQSFGLVMNVDGGFVVKTRLYTVSQPVKRTPGLINICHVATALMHHMSLKRGCASQARQEARRPYEGRVILMLCYLLTWRGRRHCVSPRRENINILDTYKHAYTCSQH